MIPPASRSAKRGFTLVELMVAIAVLSLLIILVSKIVGGASTITTYNNSHMDSNDQARLVFDRMANDFGRMLKRPDADTIFCKNTGGSSINDAIFFFAESSGDSQDSTTVSWSNERNNISLVGYRVNSDTTGSADSNYGQLERLGKALPWDTASTGSASDYHMVYLTYPTAGTTPTGTTYSSADYASTIPGAFLTSNESGSAPPIGTLANYFNDGTDPDYHVLGSQVFRFEYSFLLKDGTQSNIPIIQTKYSTTHPNGAPAVFPQNPSLPPKTDVATPPYTYPVGSRWYDSTHQIGYICTSNTPSASGTSNVVLWKEIGTQDISAIVITIATLDNAARYFIKTANSANPTMLGDIANQFPKWLPTGTNNSTSADSLVTSWENEITPPSAGAPSPLATAVAGLPQTTISRIRVYQRFFYLNTP